MPHADTSSTTTTTPTIADFYRAGIPELLAAHAAVEPWDLSPVFQEAAGAATTMGRPEAAKLLCLLADICSMMLQPDVKTAPFAPMFVDHAAGTSTLAPEHLQPDQLDLLAQMVDHVNHLPLRARLADLVWMKAKRHGNRYALRAIDDYRSAPFDPEGWPGYGLNCWKRGIQLAAELRRQATDRLEQIEDALFDAFRQAASAGAPEALCYLTPLGDGGFAKRHAGAIAKILEGLARQRDDSGNAFGLSEHLGRAINWFKRAGNLAKAAQLQAQLGHAWERHADGHAEAIARYSFYADAIQAYRAVPARYRGEYRVDETIAAVHAKYEKAVACAEASLNAVPTHHEDVDALVERARAHVTNRPALDALFAFAGIVRLPAPAVFTEAAARQFEQNLIGSFAALDIIDDGRVVERHCANNPNADAERIIADAMRLFLHSAERAAAAIIGPALEQLRHDHAFSLVDFGLLTRRCGIVPADRAGIFAQALHAGFCGDLVQAHHLLMPQFEHVVREQLKQAGILTTNHQPDRLDMEIGLSSLVDRPQMTQVFGDPQTFAIKALMCSQTGPNFRNAIAHGLADTELCSGYYGLYTWWFVLRMVVGQFRVRWELTGGTGAAAAEVQA